MKRRAFITLLGGAAAWPLAARAQQREPVRRIGVLLPATADDQVWQARLAAFHQGLAPGFRAHLCPLWVISDRSLRQRRSCHVCFAPKATVACPGRMLLFIPTLGHPGNVDQGQGEEIMSREQSLHRGAALMVLGALIFLVYAVVFFFRAFSSTGFELGVETLNGVTPQQLDQLNPAITAYIMHLHLATAGFIAATAIAVAGLAWYGVCNGFWWAWITSVIAPVLGLVVALPMHWMGHFNYDW